MQLKGFFRLLLGSFVLATPSVIAQTNLSKYAIGASVFYGNTLEHKVDIAHLLTAHPTGFFLSWSQTLHPESYSSYKNNYPEVGLSFSYHQSHVEALGNNTSLYGHIHWYFLSRMLQFKLAQGVAYADNPYHPDKNYQNNAYGSKLLAATRLEWNFLKQNIWKGVGIYTGVGIVHYSNGASKKPNTSANTMYAHIGLRYEWEELQLVETTEMDWKKENQKRNKLFYEAVLRGGANQSGIGEPTRGFFVLGGAVGKRWTYRSGWHVGTEFFYSPFLKDHIRFQSIAYPGAKVHGTEDTNRVGVYAGYDMHFSDTLSLFVDLGFYAYWPVYYEKRIYNRAGLKYQIPERPFFATLDVKAHVSKAESLEFGLGYRFN